MKHWNNKRQIFEEAARVDAFIEDIIAVYKKHGMAISHEDSEGAFIIEPFDFNEHTDLNCEWLRNAHIHEKYVLTKMKREEGGEANV